MDDDEVGERVKYRDRACDTRKLERFVAAPGKNNREGRTYVVDAAPGSGNIWHFMPRKRKHRLVGRLRPDPRPVADHRRRQADNEQVADRHWHRYRAGQGAKGPRWYA
ncbi:hypothetical protein [Spongiactinospora sp. 9N601]|uniref:hypothetical protein n=1 Tax=Spongiactinospora sp. 9N601 TaxID=3375149 RepID=UPI0037B098C4